MGGWHLLDSKIGAARPELRTAAQVREFEATPYGERGQKGVDSVCGTCCTLPNISDEDA